jgi:mannitol-1-phosphate 5-dehydrogenase
MVRLERGNREKEIIIWGAGKIGRGFIGDIFNNAGYKLYFVDVQKELVEGLRQQRRYTILNFLPDGRHEEKEISEFKIFHPDDKELIQKLIKCNLMAIAVFPSVFEEIAENIAKIIEFRSTQMLEEPLNIILCSNIINPSSVFKSIVINKLSEESREYLIKNVGFIDAVVIRMAVNPEKQYLLKDPYIVVTNGYPYMPVDKRAFKGFLPEVKGIIYSENIEAEEYRKMYTYNTAHAAYAYFGWHKGYEFVSECTEDREIQYLVEQVLDEVSEGLQREFGFSKEDMTEWNKDVLKNMKNPILKDRLERVGGDPIRKLRKNDRLIGPALMCRRNGIMPYYLSKAIAYAFLFNNPNDQSSVEIQKFVEKFSIRDAIRKYCGLEQEIDLIYLISEHYQKAIEKNKREENIAKVNLIKRAYELGFKYEKTYRGCAQCVIAALMELTGRKDEIVFQCASGFSGGIAITGDGSCGGYTGGVIYMGSYVGRRWDKMVTDGDKVAQYKSYEMAQKLHDRYIEAYGSITCSDIQNKIFGKSFCLRTKEMREEFETAGAHRDKCTSVIAIASSWITEILIDEGYIKVTSLNQGGDKNEN